MVRTTFSIRIGMLAAIAGAALSLCPSECVLAQEIREDQHGLLFQLQPLVRPNSAPVVTAVALHSKRPLLAASGDDHVIRVWDLETGKSRATLRRHTDWVKTLVFSPSGSSLFSAGNDRQILQWDIERGTEAKIFAKHETAISQLAISPDGKSLAVVGFDAKVRLYDVAGRKLTQEVTTPSSDVRAVAFSPDGKQLAAGGRSGVLRVWKSLESDQHIDIPAHRQRIRAISFSPRGEQVVSASEDRSIRVTPIDSPEEGYRLDCGDCKVFALAFVGDNQLLCGGSDNQISWWNLNDRRVATRYQGHSGSVAAVSTNGQIIASGSFDTTVRIWDTQFATSTK